MPPSVYIETTIASYLVARPSRDPIMAERQRQTREWWETRRHEYRLFTSEEVLAEAGRGDPAMARARIAALAAVPTLAKRADAILLREALLAGVPLPRGATSDAEHIALAAVYGIDFLLTWNCRHIANPRMGPRVARVCRAHRIEPPTLITPDALPGR